MPNTNQSVSNANKSKFSKSFNNIEDNFRRHVHVRASQQTSEGDACVLPRNGEIGQSQTVVQILCQDHKGVIYDTMRTLKDYNIQVSYGRVVVNKKENCKMELFIMQQSDKKKIIDQNKQAVLCSRLRMELARPRIVCVISRGPDIELLVSNHVELSG